MGKLCKVKPNWKVISWIQTDGKYTPVLSSRKLSDCVKDLLRSMLRIRPEQRAHVDLCLGHAFLSKVAVLTSNGGSNGGGRPYKQSSHAHHNRHKSESRKQSKQLAANGNYQQQQQQQQRMTRASSNYNRKYARANANG